MKNVCCDKIEQKSSRGDIEVGWLWEPYKLEKGVSSWSRLEKNCQRLGLVSVSANYVSCPRPIFGQIVQATFKKRTQCERALDAGDSEALTFSYQISALSKSCYYHIRELRCLRPYLNFKTASIIATSIVHSKLDYWNSLHYNLPQSQIKKNSRTSRTLLLVLSPEHQNLLTSLLF